MLEGDGLLFLTCISIFFARIIDVSLGTVRTFLLVKNKKIAASVVAFVEIMVWFYVAREALNTDVVSIWIPIFYSAGFAVGTLLGSYLSDKFIDGINSVQVIVREKNEKKLVSALRDEGFGVSIIELKDCYEGKNKDMLLIEITKKNMSKLIDVIKRNDKDAFVVINDTKYVQNGFIK